MNDALLNVTNSLFSQNFVLDTEGSGGGAISLNSSLFDVEREFINNTFYNNFLAGSGVGYDIANFVGNDSITSTTTLTNNAFFRCNGTSYQLEAADALVAPVTISGGGNFFNNEFGDPLLATVLGATDIVNDALDFEQVFVSEEDPLDFRPVEGSPLVDAGVTGPEVPEVDLNQFARTAIPDIGAYELNSGVELSTITELVVATDDLSSLEGLVIAAGLAGTLSGDGPFTVFAPNNAAIAGVDATTLAAISDVAELSELLRFHVVADSLTSSELTDGLTLTTLVGETITISNDGMGSISIGDTVFVIQADIIARNGVVHIVDGVLIPQVVNVSDIDGSGLEVSFFPNPVQDYLNIKITDQAVRSMDGQPDRPCRSPRTQLPGCQRWFDHEHQPTARRRLHARAAHQWRNVQ